MVKKITKKELKKQRFFKWFDDEFPTQNKNNGCVLLVCKSIEDFKDRVYQRLTNTSGGGKASYIGKLNEKHIYTVLDELICRGSPISYRKIKGHNGDKNNGEPIIKRADGTRLSPDLLIKGVPGYETGFYAERKYQSAGGSALEKYYQNIETACAGNYPLPVVFIMTLEHKNGKNSVGQKSFDTVLEYMRGRAKKCPQRVIGVFTFPEFSEWIEDRCFP
jgi:hypothetical protein